MKIKTLLICLAISSSVTAYPNPRYTFTSYSRESGLSGAAINAIEQDADGYIWLASRNGLYRFDGRRFDLYKSDKSNYFISLKCDSDSDLWALAYDGNIYRTNPNRVNITQVFTDGRFINGMYRMYDGQIYLSASDGAILCARKSDDGKRIYLSELCRIKGNENVVTIFKDSDWGTWVMTDRQLYLNGTVVSEHPAFSAVKKKGSMIFGSSDGKIIEFRASGQKVIDTALRSGVQLLSRIPGREGEILAGSPEDGIYIYDRDFTRIIKHIPYTSYNSGALSCADDGQNGLWIYSINGSLDRYDALTRTLTPFYNGNVQDGWNSETCLTAFYIDRQGNLWISSVVGDLEKVSSDDFHFNLKTLHPKDKITPENSVRAIYIYPDGGRILAATKDGGIHILNRRLDEIAHYNTGDPAYCVTMDAGGTLWVGTKGDTGLIEAVPKKGKQDRFITRSYAKDEEFYGSNCQKIYALLPGNDGRLWIGSMDDGLSYIETSDNQRRFISKRNRLSFPAEERNKMRCLAFGRGGELYAGSTRGLFYCIEPEVEPEEMQFARFSNVKEHDIQDILLSSDGTLYLCSFGGGFIRMDRAHDTESGLRCYTTSDGILSNYVLSAIEDRDGNIWIATWNGLNKFNPKTGSIIGYPYERLGYNIQFNEGEMARDSDGIIYACTNSGILYFDPSEISNSNFVPELHINELLLSGEPVRLPEDGKVLKMSTRDRLALRFSAVDMSAPEQIIYSYMIEGLNQDWVALGNRQSLAVSSLKSGRYTVRIKSTNSDGQDVDNEKHFRLRVYKPFSESVWSVVVWMLTALLFTGTVIYTRHAIYRRETAGDTLPQDDGEDPRLKGLYGNDREFVQSMLKFFEERIDDASTDIPALCNALNISRSALYGKCNALIGRTPNDLLLDMRFERAASMIASGGYSISQVAFMSGFNDPHYFSKAFKRRYGMTPSAYRAARKPTSREG